MSVLGYQYKGQPIDFVFRDDLMINATEMASVYNKEVSEFLRLSSTKKLIEALERSQIRGDRTNKSLVRSEDYALTNGTIKHRTADQIPLVIIKKGGDSGGATWIHRYLAIELASWLDIDFKIWTLSTIDHLLSNYTNVRRELALRKRNLENKLNKILSESEHEEVKEIEKLLKEKNQIKGEEFNLNKNFKENLFS